jgi:F0F1-type ATP synthase assembly protein I
MKDDRKDSHKNLMKFTLRMMGDLWTTLAAPPILLGWLGRRLDVIMETKPYVLIAGLSLSFIISTVSVCHKAVKYGEQYEALTDGPPGPVEAAVANRGGPPESPADRS